MQLEKMIRGFGGMVVTFPQAANERLAQIQASCPGEEELERMRLTLGPCPTVIERYRFEYEKGLYKAYKPGIDGSGLAKLSNKEKPVVTVEIGSGPGYVAGAAKAIWEKEVWGVDLVSHPRLAQLGINFMTGDITQPRTRNLLAEIVWERIALIVLSYCLDRVSDQRAAIKHFAELVLGTWVGFGLITVCLPARPFSPGLSDLDYQTGEWITKGVDPLEDYSLIVQACRGEGLKFVAGGLTTHYGVSLDGYEELPCYVMKFR